MGKQLKMALAAVMAASGMVTVAAPAAAAQEGNPGPWEMPDVRAMTLDNAIDSVMEVVGDVELDLRIQNRKDVRQVLNYTNWEVCAQSPRGGGEISQETRRVYLVVRRPQSSGCS